MTTREMRTLFITRSFQYPPVGGAPLRDWQNINAMMKFGPVGIVFISTNVEEANSPAESPPGVSFLSRHYVNHSLLSFREKLGRRLRQLQWLITRDHPYTDIKHYFYIESVAQELDKILAEFQPHLVVFEELWLYAYLPVIKRHKCQIILDAHNAETAMLHESIRAEANQDSQVRLKQKKQLAKLESIERDFARQVDQVWACSAQDATLLRELAGLTKTVHVVPNGINLEAYESLQLGKFNLPDGLKPQPLTLIFPASFQYKPNAMGAQLLLEKVFPLVKKTYPESRLLLVGVNPTPVMLEAAQQDSDIIVTGKVPDMLPYLAASSIVVVPLLQGGGTRLKILEAFAAGRVVVSTSKGAEGLNAQNGEHLLISDSPEELASEICKIWSNPELGKLLASSAYQLVKAEYSWEMVKCHIEQAIGKLL
ncbi:glycosyltransferase family 4 protein [Leptolyngbya sp. FACHB-261]|uniref:glycosyltransferase family 4 protein n=1 Tax=Leptolyngbya sp. FACHB-261 TaxID=2692806 RepID=UPI0016859300|nr:glycosyltransferase family 4 protein [Leptolyngbya sp. FACHB-261]MBD2101129.1 glycosyltransferase [Leptolyngbya sp. FACHB-261]